MKLTKSQLKQIIKEELTKLLNEQARETSADRRGQRRLQNRSSYGTPIKPGAWVHGGMMDGIINWANIGKDLKAFVKNPAGASLATLAAVDALHGAYGDKFMDVIKNITGTEEPVPMVGDQPTKPDPASELGVLDRLGHGLKAGAETLVSPLTSLASIGAEGVGAVLGDEAVTKAAEAYGIGDQPLQTGEGEFKRKAADVEAAERMAKKAGYDVTKPESRIGLRPGDVTGKKQ